MKSNQKKRHLPYANDKPGREVKIRPGQIEDTEVPPEEKVVKPGEED